MMESNVDIIGPLLLFVIVSRIPKAFIPHGLCPWLEYN
jgi:hypothetical protein